MTISSPINSISYEKRWDTTDINIYLDGVNYIHWWIHKRMLWRRGMADLCHSSLDFVQREWKMANEMERKMK